MQERSQLTKTPRDFTVIVDWNNPTELTSGMWVFNPFGCVVTWHSGDRTWMVHLNLLLLSLSFGYVYVAPDAEF